MRTETSTTSGRRQRAVAYLLLAGLTLSISFHIVRLRESAAVAMQPPVASVHSLDEELQELPGHQGAQPPDLPAGNVTPLQDRLFGTWRLQKHGQRTLTILADGTAGAIVELNMLGSLLYGSRLELDLTWSLDGDVMTQTMTGGRPGDAVSRLIRDWGDERQYRVDEVTEERMVLIEVGDEDDRQQWFRISKQE